MIPQKNWVGFHPPPKKNNPFSWLRPGWFHPLDQSGHGFGPLPGQKGVKTSGENQKKPVSYIKM